MDFAKFLEEEENRKKGIIPAPSRMNNFNQSAPLNMTPVTPEAQQIPSAIPNSPFDGVTKPLSPPELKSQPPAMTTGSASLLVPKQKTEQSSTATSQALPTHQEAGLKKERDNLFKEQEEVISQQSDLTKRMAEVEAEGAAMRQRQAEEAQRQQEELAARRQQAEAEAFADLQAKQKEVEGLKITDYWSNQSTSNKVVAALGLLISAVGAGATGKENMAMKALNDNIERDFQAQKANIDNAFKSLQQQGYNFQQLKDLNDRVQQDFALTQAAAYQKLQSTLESQLKNLGIPQAEIDKNAALVDLKAKKNAIEQQIQEGLRQKVDKAITEQTTLEAPAPIDDRFGRITRGDLTREDILNFVDEKDQSAALKEYGEIQKANRVSARIDSLLRQEDVTGGVLDRARGQKLKGEILDEIRIYILNSQRNPEEQKGLIDRAEQILKGATFTTESDVQAIRDMALGIVQNLTDTPLLDGYGIRPSMRVSIGEPMTNKAKDAPATKGKPATSSSRKEVKRQRNNRTGKVKIIYDDGSEEIL